MKQLRITRNLYWLLIILIITGCTNIVATSLPASDAVGEATTQTTVSQPVLVDSSTPTAIQTAAALALPTATASPWSQEPHPLQIEVMRQQTYPGSPITFEQTLEAGDGYNRFVVSYLSDGFKNYALMTIPTGTKPETGWPAIILNHGYISPAEYRTTERYVDYVDRIACSGYIVLKPDYRGHGSSEGGPEIGGGYGSPDYTVDVLNAVASLQAYADADPNRIGMWGHSMGGQITLRAMVVSQDIRAGVIWGGVVSPYPDIIARWDFTRNPGLFPGLVISEISSAQSSTGNWLQGFSGWVKEFSTLYGEVDQNPDFWATISPNTYLADLSGPIQLHHSTTDEMVPLAWSETLAVELQTANQTYELYTYPDDNHNISANFETAMQRTIAFFDEYVKGH